MDRYYSFSHYCQDTFGKKLYRVALNAGMSCPNRDGTCGDRGCIFCAGGSGDFAIPYNGQLLQESDLVFNHINHGEGTYIAYFQAYSNTYAPAHVLAKLFEGALKDPLFAGISIATRPDCFNDEIYQLLAHLKQHYPDKFIWIELGLQTMHETSAIWMHRGYPLEVFDACVHRLHALEIPVIVHVILGLPMETINDVIETILYLNTCDIAGIKLQLLHILSDTELGEQYVRDPDEIKVLTEEEYIEMVCMCIGYLKPGTVIHRLSGDGNKDSLLAPMWSLNKKHVLNRINHTLKEKNIVQGCFLQSKSMKDE